MFDENKVYMSVVAPAYNEGANLPHLVEQVERALSKFEKSWEFIIVDDGSRDNSLDVLKSLMAQKPFLRVIHFLSNSGQSGSRSRNQERIRPGHRYARFRPAK